MRLIVAKDYADVSRKAANIIAAQVHLKPDCVLGLATGSSPIGTYQELIAKYEAGELDFSQDAVIKLAPAAGIELDESLSLAEKLKAVQKLMEADDPRAQKIFEAIGIYFGYTVVLYSQFYDLDYIMLMGRVMSGKGGDTILRVCNELLAEEYPELAAKCCVTLPDEKMRRVGQAVAAASLPKAK